MTKCLKFLVLVSFTFAVCTIAQAQATRTWVSGVGDDVNPCSRTAPCKTFAGAISKTAINGEIDCLDPGGFGAVTITKSITIDGTGTFGSILASGTNGVIVNIAVNANDPFRNVTLRGLSINGTGVSGAVGTRTGVVGVSILNASAVHVEDCLIANFSQNGIKVNNVPNNFNLFIRNSVIRDNSLSGVVMTSTNSVNFMRGSFEGSEFSNNQNGIEGGANSRITATRCVMSGNTGDGVLSRSLTAALFSVVNLNSCVLANNGTNGVEAGNGGALATSFVRITDNHITGNLNNGVLVGSNGQVQTYGDNAIKGNAVADDCPACTVLSPAKS